MAQKILGVDLGAAATKLARIDARFRKAALLDTTLESAPPSHETGDATERLLARLDDLRHLLSERRIAADEIVLALPGQFLTFRVVDLPFSDERKIESVLGYELEAQVMTSIDELVIDHVVVGQRGSSAGERSEPGGIRETRVLVAAAPRALITAVVAKVTALGLPVRMIAAAPLAYAPLLAPLAADIPGATLVADIGHETTSVVVLRDATPELARTIPRGGRHFTDALATAFRLDADAAERSKLDAGFIGHAGLVPETVAQQRMSDVLREAARPLVRELRQTLAAYHASYNAPVERIVLAGGSARLVGLAEHLREELGVAAVQHLPAAPVGEGDGESVETPERDRLAVALGTVEAGLGTPFAVNFRKGELAYKSDFSFLRGKALHLGVLAGVVLLFAGINAAVALRGLNAEHTILEERLKKATTEVFGQPRSDARAVSDELKGGAGGKGGGPPIPTVTAYDVLDEISRRVPPSDKITLDITEIDIKPKKTFIKGTAATAQQVDDLADALSKIECFEDIKKDKISSVMGPGGGSSAGADGGTGPHEIKQFTLTITTTCP